MRPTAQRTTARSAQALRTRRAQLLEAFKGQPARGPGGNNNNKTTINIIMIIIILLIIVMILIITLTLTLD